MSYTTLVAIQHAVQTVSIRPTSRSMIDDFVETITDVTPWVAIPTIVVQVSYTYHTQDKRSSEF